MSASFETLPPELYSAILDLFPPTDLQRTTLSLLKALPKSPIPEHYLFSRIHLKRAEQVVQLNLRLRKARANAEWVKDFSLETWTVDADVAVNLIHLLPQIKELTLFVGPNFSPEHLEEIFESPMPTLQFISLRFRPYVQKATYYQFLKGTQGAYFDSTLLALSRWPRSQTQPLPSLSIIQDPIDPEVAQQHHFAQPLVFFRLDPLTALVSSDYLQSLNYFRLRIPGRQIVRFICAYPGSLPSVEFLDVSTGMILESEVEVILMRFTKLKHLLLDGCNMRRLDGLDGEWAALGKRCALAGVKRAKERERKLKAWLEENAARSIVGDQPIVESEIEQRGGRHPRRGRRGLATATISLREPVVTAGGPSRSVLPSTLQGYNVPIPRIRILPPTPSLISLAVSPSSHVSSDRHPDIRADFERGWSEGLTQLNATLSRLRQSWQNGIRIVRFCEKVGVSEVGLDGLVDVKGVEEASFHAAEGSDGRTPMLCLVGSGTHEGHLDGCGHAVGQGIWKDDL